MRGRRLRRKAKLVRLKPKVVDGYFMIPKTELPPKQIIEKLELKPLNLRKYRRKGYAKGKAKKK